MSADAGVTPALRPGVGVRVRVPASSANLGPGFDSLGLALGVWDEYDVTPGGSGLRVEVHGEGAHQVPLDRRHLVYRCLVRGLAALGHREPADLQLTCRNAVPHSRGMGSSATAAVAGFAAASALDALARGDAAPSPDTGASTDGRGQHAVPLDLALVNELAAQAEGHPDNSSASVYGGMTVSWSDDVTPVAGVHTVQVAVHEDVVPVVLVPDHELATAAARAALPTEVPLKAAALNAGRAALLVEAMSRRPELLLAATRDYLHQEQRRVAYPDTMRVVDALRGLGHAATVSGAGPTVLVLTTRARTPQVQAAAGAVAQREASRWRVLCPGVPPYGVSAATIS